MTSGAAGGLLRVWTGGCAMRCAMGCVASCRGVEVLQARTHLCCCSGWRVLLGVGRPAHSCARKRCYGSGCCVRVRVRVPPQQRRRA